MRLGRVQDLGTCRQGSGACLMPQANGKEDWATRDHKAEKPGSATRADTPDRPYAGEPRHTHEQ